METYWTDTALEHLDAIYFYIASDSIDYAKRIVDRLTSRSIQISTFPESGRMVPEIESKERVVICFWFFFMFFCKKHKKICTQNESIL